MGTNYHLRYNICNKCNRYEELHIGKSSYKWKFLFHSIKKEDLTTDLITYDQWVDFLKIETENNGSKIFDEYGREIELEELLSLVTEKQCDKGHEFDDTKLASLYHTDVKGYDFCTKEFS